MKTLFKQLFFEKIVMFHEGANALAYLLKKAPFFADKITNEWFGKENKTQKTVFSVLYFIGRVILEFLKKLAFVLVFVYIPYRILGALCPNILLNQQKSILYFFIIIIAFCGTIVNTTLFTLTDRDYIMLRIIRTKVNMYYLGRVVYRMISEFVYYAFILLIFGVGIRYSICASFVTMLARPIGELIGLFCYNFMKKIHGNRGSLNGMFMSLAILVAYLVPYVDRDISELCYLIGNPILLVIMLIVGLGAICILYTYKKYELLEQESVYIRRDELA